jgi:alpha-beta hydrolase superfamily lysophospholipase
MAAELTVVLLHGLARRAGSLAGLGRALEQAGFATWSCDYPSRRTSIRDAAADIADRIAAELPGRPLGAVTHSLGGILVRHMGDRGLDWRRIVMLAPPSQGSQIAATLARHPLFRWFYGPAGQELGGDPATWPPPPAPAAVIAGTKRRALVNPTSWVSHRMFADDVAHDGTVAVDEARLPGAAFATVDATHTVIMDDANARRLAIRFLRGDDL